MNKVDGQKIILNLVTLEKWLVPDENFQRLSIQKRIFTKRIIDVIIKNVSQSSDYCLMLRCRCPKAFSLFIDILIETKQNATANLF